MMNQNGTTQILKLVLTTTLFVMLSSCGNTKSSEAPTTNNFSSTATKLLASCNKLSNANVSLNASVFMDQYDNVDNNLIKVKFNFLSSQNTAAGNKIKFFKGRSINGVITLNQTPLPISAYNISSGQIAAATPEIAASTVNSSVGYYLSLNDFQDASQVIKVVVYDSSNAVVSHSDFLIPQFYAKTSDYQYNSDGTTRSAALQSLHPLNGTNTAGWTDTQFASHFQAFCF